MEVEVDGRWTEESWKVESGRWKLEGRIMENEWRTINSLLLSNKLLALPTFHLTHFYRTRQRRKRVVEEGHWGLRGTREGREMGGRGTATDAIDLHDPVRNGWEAS